MQMSRLINAELKPDSDSESSDSDSESSDSNSDSDSDVFLQLITIISWNVSFEGTI